MIYVVNCAAAIDVCHELGMQQIFPRLLGRLNGLLPTPRRTPLATIMTFTQPSGSLIMTMSQLCKGPARG